MFWPVKISCTMKAKKTLPKRHLMVLKQCSTRKRRFEIGVLKRFRSRRGHPRTDLPRLAHDPVAVTAAKLSWLAALSLRPPVPLADQQAFEQNQRIVAESDSRSLQTTLWER